MTFIPTTVATTAATAAAAQQRQRALRREEELMSKYAAEEIEGWEFKIVRSSTRKFRKREFVQRVREEESRAGWEMLEKFDDYRIRFKRRVEQRAEDHHLEIDPYRTHVGMSARSLELSVIVGALVGTALVALLIFLVVAGAR